MILIVFIINDVITMNTIRQIIAENLLLLKESYLDKQELVIRFLKNNYIPCLRYRMKNGKPTACVYAIQKLPNGMAISTKSDSDENLIPLSLIRERLDSEDDGFHKIITDDKERKDFFNETIKKWYLTELERQ